MSFKKILVLSFVILLVNTGLVFANYTIGNNSKIINSSYAPLQVLSGTINISILDESNDSLISSDFGEITLGQFLYNNGKTTYCKPLDCTQKLSLYDESSSKSFSLESRESKVFGIKFVSNGDLIESIKYLEFNISTDGGSSCLRPIMIDIGNKGSWDYKVENTTENDYCPIQKPYGCFNPEDSTEEATLIQEDEEGVPRYNELCEKVNVTPVKAFEVGANLIKNSGDLVNSYFVLSLTIQGNTYSCDVYANSSGTVSCVKKIDLDLSDITEAEICIRPKEDELFGEYSVRFEKIKPCGYVKNYPSGTETPEDFEIYVKPLKFKSINRFKLDKSLVGSDIASDVLDYIDRTYSKNCTPECVVPIKIYSGVKQNINVNTMNATYYLLGGDKKYITNIGQIKSQPPLISTNGFQLLDLSKAEFSVPSESGKYDVTIELNGTEIMEGRISVNEAAEIVDIVPHEVYSLIPMNIMAIFKDEPGSSATYEWKIGNATAIVTNKSYLTYTFEDVGTYYVTLRVINKNINSSKTVALTASSPVESINKTLKSYKSSLINFSGQLDSLPTDSKWIRDEIDGAQKTVDVDSLKDSLDKIQKRFDESLSSEESEKIQIMKDLLALDVPKKLKTTQDIGSSPYLQNENQVDFTKMTSEFGASEISEDKTSALSKLNTWIRGNLNASFSSKTYSVKFESGKEVIMFSDITFELIPEDDIEELYFVINGDTSKIKLRSSDLKTTESTDGQATGIELKELSSGTLTRIEFLYPGEIDMTNLPVYISPDPAQFSQGGVDTGDCNNNRKCEDGENYKNCSDCKPWGTALLLIVILVFIALVVYIVMQEWYKRHYENYLFTNKTQLFNLINFMHNAYNQGLKKPEILSKLKDQGWNNEQMEYAWKKFRGERVGMWEIPVFKWFENKKVKEELLKRNPSLSKPSTPAKNSPAKGFFKK